MYLRVQSIETFLKLECGKQVNQLRNELIKKFKISNEFFIEMQKDLVNGVLFSLFGNTDCLMEQEFKELYLENDKISNNTKGKLHRIFCKTASKNMLKEQDKGQFIKQIRDNFHIISLHKQLIQSCNQAWDEIAPKALPRKYPYIYFKLPQYQVIKLKQDKRKVVIIKFQIERSSLLCVIQTQEYFSMNQMDKIVDQIELQNNSGNNIEENNLKIKGQVNNPQIKNKLKNQPNKQNNNKKSVQIEQASLTTTSKSQQNDLTSQQINIQQLKKQLEKQKLQSINRSNLYTTLFFIIFIVFIVFSVFLLNLYEKENSFHLPIIQSQSQQAQQKQAYLDFIVYFPDKIIPNIYIRIIKLYYELKY